MRPINSAVITLLSFLRLWLVSLFSWDGTLILHTKRRNACRKRPVCKSHKKENEVAVIRRVDSIPLLTSASLLDLHWIWRALNNQSENKILLLIIDMKENSVFWLVVERRTTHVGFNVNVNSAYGTAISDYHPSIIQVLFHSCYLLNVKQRWHDKENTQVGIIWYASVCWLIMRLYRRLFSPF